jgi:hypothetical protein
MRHNVPRLGHAGGFVHAGSGKFECADGKLSTVIYQEGVDLSVEHPNIEVTAEPTGPSNHVCTGVVREWDSINSRLLPPNALKAELTRLRESGWRPIAEAPKDGTEVDLWMIDRFGGRRHCGCVWHKWQEQKQQQGSWYDAEMREVGSPQNRASHFRLPPPPPSEKA